MFGQTRCTRLYFMTIMLSRDMGELDEVASLAERGALMYRQVLSY